MSIDFTFSPEQSKLRTDARSFARQYLGGVRESFAGLNGPEERFASTRSVYEELVRAGYLTMQIPAPLGGTMTSMTDLALVVEELIAVESSVPLSILSTGLGLMPLLFFGSEEQHTRFLPPFTSGEGAPLASLAFGEPGGTANYANPDPARGLTTFARREGDEWVINGTKGYAPHATGWDGSHADLFTVTVRTDPTLPPQESLAVLIVPGNTPGIVVEQTIDTIGYIGAEVCRVRFDEVRVPVANMIGAPGDGILIAETCFSATAGMVGAMCVGTARAAFDIALEFARTEYRGGDNPIIEHQNVGTLLGGMKAKLEASRYMTWKACSNFDRSNGTDDELSIINKVFASENTIDIVNDAIRVVGIEAYSQAIGLGQLLNDAVVYSLFDGGNVGVRRPQIQRILAGKDYDALAACEGRL